MNRHLGCPRRSRAALACAALATLAGAGLPSALAQTATPISAFSLGDVRINSVTSGPIGAYSLTSPPLAGFQPHVVVGLTDERRFADDVVGYADQSSAPAGNALPLGGPNQYVVATLDSGAQAHIFNPAASAGFNFAGAGRDGTKSAEVQGAGGSSIFIPITDGVGVYAAGIQNATGGTSIGVTTTLRGATNNPVLAVDEADPRFPNIIGAPILAHYQAVIQNSQTRHLTVGSQTYRGPSVTLQPVNTPLPVGQGYSRIQLTPTEAGPPEDPYFFNFDFSGSDNPDTPAAWPLLLASTAVSHTGGSHTNDFLFDTGAQVSLISEFTASQIGIFVDHPDTVPDFFAEVLAVDQVLQVPGFFINGLSMTTTGGVITWDHVPVLVHNVADPRSPSSALPGLIGMNLFNDRDLIVNAGVFGPPGSTYVAFGPKITPRWTHNGNGAWGEDENWSLGSPDGTDLQANFTNAITADATITVDAVGFTVGAMKFDNAHRYTINGPGTLRLEAFSIGNALIDVVSGSHTIGSPVTLLSDTTINVGPAGSTLAMSGHIDGPLANVTKTGAGTVLIANVRAKGLNVTAGSVVVSTDGTPSGMVQVESLAVGPGAKLDVHDNDIIVDYDQAGPSPEFALRDKVLLARDGDVEGIFFIGSDDINSDKVLAFGEAFELGFTEFNGVEVDDSTIVGKFTYYGDANFDGQVTTDDYVAVDLGLGTGNSWVQGDFDLNGFVSTDDYVVVDLNLGKGTGDPLAYADEQAAMIALHTEMFGQSYLDKLAYASEFGWVAASVPEPGASVALLALGGSFATRRRLRRHGRATSAAL